jgi:hypothetical protein
MDPTASFQCDVRVMQAEIHGSDQVRAFVALEPRPFDRHVAISTSSVAMINRHWRTSCIHARNAS